MNVEPVAEDAQVVEATPVDEEAALHARLLNNPYVPEATEGKKRHVAKMTPALKRKFCKARAKGASITKVAETIGVARSTIYYQMGIDPDFVEACQDAQERDADRYEDALDHLATKTRNVGAVIFALKNKRPDKWKDRQEVGVQRTNLNVNLEGTLPPGAERALLQQRLARLEAEEVEALQPGQGGTSASTEARPVEADRGLGSGHDR